MRLRVVGVQRYDFESKDRGRVHGLKLHTLDENVNNPNYTGAKCEVVSCKDEVYMALVDQTKNNDLVGHVVNVEYNSYGKAQHITLVE